MSTFHFKLERVMQWRALELSSEEAKLRRLMEEEALLQLKLERIRNIISEMPVRIAALEEIHGSDLNRMAGYKTQLTHELGRISGLCREKKRAVLEQAEIHRRAKQRYRLLEELRNRRQVEWKTRASRELEELAQESYLAQWKTL
jgi:hypothetical protein